MFYVYDIECYRNVWTCTVIRPSDLVVWRFEISFRRHDGVAFFNLVNQINASGGRMVGFNNIGYDYPVIHEILLRGGHMNHDEIFTKSDGIINTPWDNRFSNIVWESEHFAPQIDLFLIHHFDNPARSTSLKMLENNMRSENIQDLPFKPATNLTSDEIDQLIIYNDHDVYETIKFLIHSLKDIEFRDEMTAEHGLNFTNFNDTKIGKQFFVLELEKRGIQCYHKVGNKKAPRQTVRSFIDLGSVILPSIQFQHPELQRVHNWLKGQRITKTKGVFDGVVANVNGFEFVFGLGGLHGSIESQVVVTDEDFVVIDVDVKSYYPNVAIENDFYPEHLGVEFCEIYKDFYNQRQLHAKGTVKNGAYKLGLNGVYGDSNNGYSPFFDSAYTMAITLNGQLLLCLLAEQLLNGVQGLSMVQVNTDGVTVKCPRGGIDRLTQITQAWEGFTGLELERVDYSRMFIRDVNSYIAEELDGGKLKRKGAYCHGKDLGWAQNHSCQIVAIAAERALTQGVPIEYTIMSHENNFDFMLRTKVPRNSQLVIEKGGVDRQVQNITRYYISTDGGQLVKIMPPLAKQLAVNPQAPMRRMMVSKGWMATECNDLRGVTTLHGLNLAYYIAEAHKIVDCLRV